MTRARAPRPADGSSGATPTGSLMAGLRADLAAAGCAPLHRFGQNFMIDAKALDALVAALGAVAGSRIVEIGPGTGILTRRLLAVGAEVLAVEIDRGLHAHLAGGLALEAEGRLRLIHGDCLASKTRLHPEIEAYASSPWRLGANLPYDVALPVLLNAAALPVPPEVATVTVQYEAAVRLCSHPGDEAWGSTAVVLQAAGRPELLRRLGPGSFHPRPRVDSALLRWTPVRALPPGFPTWCRTLFAYRRKVLPGGLRDAGVEPGAVAAILHAAGLEAGRRVEDLDPDEHLRLHAAVTREGAT